MRTLLLAVPATVALTLTQRASPSVTLSTLTVPATSLSANCSLVPAATEQIGSRLRTGLWAGLPISSNPWTGNDANVIASIRERISLPRNPDGPPLTARESARYRRHLADGIRQAYVAIYEESSSDLLTVVYGLELSGNETALEFLRDARLSSTERPLAAAIGPLVVVMSGEDRECTKTVRVHLQGLVVR